jgi:transposase
MHYFACDVSRDGIEAVLTDRVLTVKRRFTINNTVPAISNVLRSLQSDGLRLTAAAESTAMFHVPLVEACAALAIPCKLLNPVLTRQVLRHSVRKRKTDQDDALTIAKLLVQGEGHPVTPGDVLDVRKTLSRSARKVSVLAQCLTLHARHVGRSLGTIPAVLSEQCDQLKRTKTQMQKLATAQTDVAQRKLLESIPGIGSWIATVLIAETQNFSRCDSGDALVAAAGLDPRVKQSGVTLNRNGKLTKRGSPHLRWALGCAANVAIRYDPELKAYYEKKRSEGKSYRTALCATSRKLAYRVFAVAKRRTPYCPACVT